MIEPISSWNGNFRCRFGRKELRNEEKITFKSHEDEPMEYPELTARMEYPGARSTFSQKERIFTFDKHFVTSFSE